MQQPPIVEYLKKKAYEQGFQQGAQEASRKCILKVLKFRFQFDAAQTFKSTLDAIEDLQRLEHLFDAAMQVETPEGFTQALNKNSE